jgi:hypothetical protein
MLLLEHGMQAPSRCNTSHGEQWRKAGMLIEHVRAVRGASMTQVAQLAAFIVGMLALRRSFTGTMSTQERNFANG